MALRGPGLFQSHHGFIDRPVEGSHGVTGTLFAAVTAAHFGLSAGTVSSWFGHVVRACFRSLKSLEPPLIAWPDEEKIFASRGLINGCPNAIGFVDGRKVPTMRPKDEMEEVEGYHTAMMAVTTVCSV